MRDVHDVLLTRRHYYPRWILFPDWNYPVLALRTVVGQACCDFAIEEGSAVPIAQKHDSIADAMHRLPNTHPEISSIFYDMLAHPEIHRMGWYDFLREAADYFIGRCLQDYWPWFQGQDQHQARTHAMIRWHAFFDEACRPLENSRCGSFGFEFEWALVTTRAVVEGALAESVIVWFALLM